MFDCIAVGLIEHPEGGEGLSDLLKEKRRWLPAYALLILYFLLILTTLLLI